jgi:5'-nucleotidase
MRSTSPLASRKASPARRIAPVLVAAALGAALVAPGLSNPVGAQTASSAPAAPNTTPGVLDLQLLGLNDFHGNLEPPAGSGGRIGTTNAGGAEYLAAHIRRLRNENNRTIVAHAGDLIGASPIVSAIFKDEPTIEIMRLIGLDVLGVGNHEFDEGHVELQRIAGGGCHPTEGCFDGVYAGATFPTLAANVIETASGNSILPAWDIRVVDGVKIGFIGVTLEGTPTIVAPSGVRGLKFEKESVALNRTAALLKGQYGVNTIVALIHEGVIPADTDPQGCNGVTGPITNIVKDTSADVDVFITGHTHQAYICTLSGRPVTSAASFGRLITKIDLKIDKSTGKVMSSTARNVVVTRDIAPAADVTSYITRTKAKAAPRTNRVLGRVTADITRTQNPAGESALGNLIADSQLAATSGDSNGKAVIAFMNPGGVRTDLIASQTSGGEAAGDVTYGESFAVQPFGNNLMTITMTGADILEVLEQQFDNPSAGQNRILSASKGFTYSWAPSAAKGKKVSDAKLDGTGINPTSTYRVTVNNFLADGGDLFTAFVKGKDRLGGVVDLDALEAAFAKGPLSPPAQDRITLK